MTPSRLPLPARRMLTEQQAADYLSIPVSTFRRLVKVQPVKLGTRTRFDVRDLDRFLDGVTLPADPMDGLEGIFDEAEGARH